MGPLSCHSLQRSVPAEATVLAALPGPLGRQDRGRRCRPVGLWKSPTCAGGSQGGPHSRLQFQCTAAGWQALRSDPGAAPTPGSSHQGVPGLPCSPGGPSCTPAPTSPRTLPDPCLPLTPSDLQAFAFHGSFWLSTHGTRQARPTIVGACWLWESRPGVKMLLL